MSARELPDWAEMGAPPPDPTTRDIPRMLARIKQAQREVDETCAAHDAALKRERALGVSLVILTGRIGRTP
jgi:formate dehydrogenase assembly factor FdhD